MHAGGRSTSQQTLWIKLYESPGAHMGAPLAHTYTRQLKPKSPPVSPQTRTYTRTAWNILVGIVRSKVIWF
jgi:hypothetical protein